MKCLRFCLCTWLAIVILPQLDSNNIIVLLPLWHLLSLWAQWDILSTIVVLTKQVIICWCHAVVMGCHPLGQTLKMNCSQNHEWHSVMHVHVNNIQPKIINFFMNIILNTSIYKYQLQLHQLLPKQLFVGLNLRDAVGCFPVGNNNH